MENRKLTEKGVEITQKYAIFLHENNTQYIKMGEWDESFWSMKMRIHYVDGEELDMNKIHIDLLNTYISCGLGKKNNKQIIVSSFSILPMIHTGTGGHRSLLVTIKYG
jgi:hypothetical protein